MRRRGFGCVSFGAKSSTAAKRTEHSRKHSEVFQNSTFGHIIIQIDKFNAERRGDWIFCMNNKSTFSEELLVLSQTGPQHETKV